MLTRTKYSICALVAVILLSGTVHVTGLIHWEDDFTTDSDEWTFDSYDTETSNNPITSDFQITDGVLKAPDVEESGEMNAAYHASTISTGNWSYDWYVPEDEIVYDSFNFMFTDHSTDMNFTGFTERQLNLTGYGIVFDAERPQIRLFKWLVLSDTVTTNYANLASVNSFSSEPIAGLHHIDITRNADGVIQVYLDKELKIKTADTTHSTSEYFYWGSFKGDSYIDNLVV
ncbi:MAG: hypothetical protein KAR35_06960, partial [Candidatus Heimdallarchaeota archaeon]|nr:hypothetical protein [Candidatus Heimdallarchaeota archaeon]MCK5049099.1 hypothetical protein [Candidatus Heimdallarchaeota archaeon]